MWANSSLAECCNRGFCFIVRWRSAVVRNKRYRLGDSLVSTVKIIAHYQAIDGIIRREKIHLIRSHRFKELVRDRGWSLGLACQAS